MTKEERERIMDIIQERFDVTASKVKYHEQRLDKYCLHEGGSSQINGNSYYRLCGNPKGHKGLHQDIEGGVWW